MLWNQWFMNVQDYSCPTIVLLKEKVLLLLGLQVNDGIFKEWPPTNWPTNQPTNKVGSRDAIASKNYWEGGSGRVSNNMFNVAETSNYWWKAYFMYQLENTTKGRLINNYWLTSRKRWSCPIYTREGGG